MENDLINDHYITFDVEREILPNILIWRTILLSNTGSPRPPRRSRRSRRTPEVSKLDRTIVN